MRKLSLLFAIVLLFSVAAQAAPPAAVTSIDPTVFFQTTDTEPHFLTINGYGLLGAGGELITFSGTAGNHLQFTVPPNAESDTQLLAAVPSDILNTLGKYTVKVAVFDADGHPKNLQAGSFQVVTPPPPPPPPPVIFAPEQVVAEATSSSGAVVDYTVTAQSADSTPIPVTCTPPSGSLFPLGSTNVHCTASDANGTATADFPVIVADTTPPELFLPADITTTNPTVTYTATATDNIDGPITPVCDPPSGSTFPVGTTEVQCSATDASLNVTFGSFFVTVVVDNTPPVVTSITASPSTLSPPNHQMVPVTITVVATDDTDPNPVSQIISVSSNQPIEGTGDGDQSPDWEITGALTLNLRSERAGNSNADRVYTITVATSDANGNTTISTVLVTVPH